VGKSYCFIIVFLLQDGHAIHYYALKNERTVRPYLQILRFPAHVGWEFCSAPPQLLSPSRSAPHSSGGVSGTPSTSRASCSCGTLPITSKASPSANVDRSYSISMPLPSTRSADIRTVRCGVACPAGRALLGGVRRVHHLHADPSPFSLVGDEKGQLVEAPGVRHAVVFAGYRSTTFACRARTYPGGIPA
jgi:hypothetical protein